MEFPQMQLKSTPTRYGAIAIAIHWVTALAIIGLLASGLIMDRVGDETVRSMLPVHAIMGGLILVLTLVRIGWWVWGDRHPVPLPGQPRLQELAAKLVHLLLYVAIIVLAASGMATMALSGAVPALLAGAPLPDFDGLLPRSTHGLVARLLIALFAVHVAAALYHQFIRRDRLLGRMGIGSS